MSGSPDVLDSLTSDTFANLVGQTFRMRVDPATVLDVELTEVTPRTHEPSASEGRRQQFSIVFRVPGAEAYPQGTFTFDHESIGTLDLFAVPVAQDERGIYYEAVFT